MANHVLVRIETNALWQIIQTPGITDLVIDGSDLTRADFGSGFQVLAPIYKSDQEMVAAIVELALEAGSRIDIAKPVADFVLQGARFHAVLPFGLCAKLLLSIRVHAPETKSLEVLQTSGMLTLTQLAWLKEQVRGGKSMVLCGPTGVGKTTLLRALLQDSKERIICIEQTPELCLPAPAISLTERQANQEGAGQIELDELIVHALRMRPDRIVVGEVRSKEFRVLLQAINNGHSGTLTSLHATSLASSAERFLVLGLLGGFATELTERLVAQSIDFVVQLGRVNGKRLVTAIGRPVLSAAGLQIERLDI